MKRLGDNEKVADESPPAIRAVLVDFDATPATATIENGPPLEGWVVFAREHRFSDDRDELTGVFWYERDPAAPTQELPALTICCGDFRVEARATREARPLMSSEPTLARIDFIDARHMRD